MHAPLTVDSVEPRLRDIAAELVQSFPAAARTPLRTLQNRAIARSASHPDIRAALFRFVDVAPACVTPEERGAHLAALLTETPSAPGMVRGWLARDPVQDALGRGSAPAVATIARRFIAGRDPDRAARVLARQWQRGRALSVDLLGEHTVTAAEADRYAERCQQALRQLSAAARGWPARPILERDSLGPLPRVNLSIKVTALTAELRASDPRRGVLDALPRVRALAHAARDLGGHLHLDMESYDSREIVTGVLAELLTDPGLREGPSLGIVLQAYLRDSPEQLDQLLEFAEQSGRPLPLTVRLVKGAYWDHETVDATQHGWTPPTFGVKAETDRNFETLTRRLLDARPVVRVAIASHNLRSVAHAIAYNRARQADDRDLEIQVLRGLGDDLGHAVARLGLRARIYTPVGNVVEGMAYLVRRLLENTSNDSFLATRAHGQALDQLLQAP